MPPRTAKTQLKMAERRRQVAEFYAVGLTQTEIAEQVKCDQSTVSTDIKAIISQYHAEAPELLERERLGYDRMERDAALEFKTTKDPTWFGERLRLKQQRTKLLRLDEIGKNEEAPTGAMPVYTTVVLVPPPLLPAAHGAAAPDLAAGVAISLGRLPAPRSGANEDEDEEGEEVR